MKITSKLSLMLLSILLLPIDAKSFNFPFWHNKPTEEEQPSVQKPSAKKYNVGVVSITEDITPKIGYKIIQQIELALKDSNINGVLIHINSGGGSIGTAALIKRSLEELKSTKPVVTLVENMCFSSAYTLATGTNWIIAPYGAEVGCIGTLTVIERQKKNQKVTTNGHETETVYELFYKGQEKVIRHYFADELTEQERSIINKHLEFHYQELCSIICKSRNLSLEKSHEWAEGKLFFGSQALELGLIDEVGGLPEAKAYFKKAFSTTADVLDATVSFSLIP